ncbi:Uncharacterised protein [uncultured archaeon]|nr:Uncharacterised protein [uncultured archaeon]
MATKIRRDMLIGELIMAYPAAVEVLFERGFHCIGCGLSAYETLEQGCAAHGFDDAVIDEILKEIEKKTEEEKARLEGVADSKEKAGGKMAEKKKKAASARERKKK